ncbi:MAG TPA: hypothetical protein PKA28_03595 [Methylomusa anaerophila]|uniref:Uncharacterized protein n=1 Tax=Methylomusa anaerophila TaxID=1930071 RepID=A0A348ANI9_9FIRM|nr:hypothetical protein [Methylomusa anaerophila]BBB92637.1 hypothetical protein MAMMFC1_03332 [Methylomusa anaerophila]HML87511.1 hypothetical protein [Methylomusa anaerophila]
MHKVLLLVACCSFLWNYDIPQRYMSCEKGKVRCGRRLIRLALLKLGRRVGAKAARQITLALIFLVWLCLSCYFIAVGAFFHTTGPKVVSMLAAILGTMALGQEMAHAYRNFAEWCYNREENVLMVSKGCWEIILAGLVFVNVLFYNN